jgi:hypothetical protein
MRKLFLSVLVGIVLAGIAFMPSVAWAHNDCVNTEVSFLSGSLTGEVVTVDLVIIPTIPKVLSVLDVNNIIKTNNVFEPVANTKEVLGVASLSGILCKTCPAIGLISDSISNGINAQPETVLLC